MDGPEKDAPYRGGEASLHPTCCEPSSINLRLSPTNHELIESIQLRLALSRPMLILPNVQFSPPTGATQILTEVHVPNIIDNCASDSNKVIFYTCPHSTVHAQSCRPA